MKKGFFLGFLVLSALTNFSPLAHALDNSETGDYCLDDSLTAIRKQVDGEVKILKVWKDSGCQRFNNGPGVCYWLTTNLCKGNLVMQVWTYSTECKTNYEGERTVNFIDEARSWGTGECEELADKIASAAR